MLAWPVVVIVVGIIAVALICSLVVVLHRVPAHLRADNLRAFAEVVHALRGRDPNNRR